MVQPRIGEKETVGMMVRMPADLRDRIKATADSNGRSQNSEIVATLEEKYPAPRAKEDQLRFVMSLIDDIRQRQDLSVERKRSQLRILYILMMNIAGDLTDEAYEALTLGWDEPPEFDDPDFIMTAIDPAMIRPTPTDD